MIRLSVLSNSHCCKTMLHRSPFFRRKSTWLLSSLCIYLSHECIQYLRISIWGHFFTKKSRNGLLMWKWHMLMRTSGNVSSSAEILAKSLSTIIQHVKQVSYLLDKTLKHFAINFISSIRNEHMRPLNYVYFNFFLEMPHPVNFKGRRFIQENIDTNNKPAWLGWFSVKKLGNKPVFCREQRDWNINVRSAFYVTAVRRLLLFARRTLGIIDHNRLCKWWTIATHDFTAHHCALSQNRRILGCLTCNHLFIQTSWVLQ